MHFLADYGIFLAKTLTLVIAVILTLVGVIAVASKEKEREKLEITKINDHFNELAKAIKKSLMSKSDLKQLHKAEKKDKKTDKKTDKKGKAPKKSKRIFVLNFQGDIRASKVSALREEITAILQVAEANKDEVVLKLESPGGAVHGYGLAASQLQRLKQKEIPLTICVDKVAASGGYMMACVADKILAAPFAIIGSIGVVAQMPNFNKLLKKNNIEFEQVTAGEYKRTLTMFGENTNKARNKFQDDINEIHQHFKNFIQANRKTVAIEQVATGEHWLATQAQQYNLVDELMTSDDYLLSAADTADLYKLHYRTRKKLGQRFAGTLKSIISSLYQAPQEEAQETKFLA